MISIIDNVFFYIGQIIQIKPICTKKHNVIYIILE